MAGGPFGKHAVLGAVVENEPTRDFLADSRGTARSVDGLLRGLRTNSVLANFARCRILNRPVFLTATDHRRLSEDVVAVHDLLEQLPDRLFDGDLRRYATAVGLRPPQIELAVRASRLPVIRMGRADLYRTAAGFRLLEFNSGSTAGGWEAGWMLRGAAKDPEFRLFAERHDLAFVDPLINYAAAATGGHSDEATVAIIDCPARVAGVEPPFFSRMLNDLRRLGINAVSGHLGQLEYRAGRVQLDGRPVDTVYRRFGIGDLLGDPEMAGLTAALLDAAERGAIRLVTPLHSAMYGSKACLAMLSDERNASAFEPAQRTLVNRFVPWTRQLREGKTEAQGDRVDLIRYVLGNREHLVLKPTLSYGGKGVVAGWLVGDAEWEHRVRAALADSYVVQERVVPVLERFVEDRRPDEFQQVVLTWGAFSVGSSYSGTCVLGAEVDERGVLKQGIDYRMGCAFHVDTGSNEREVTGTLTSA